VPANIQVAEDSMMVKPKEQLIAERTQRLVGVEMPLMEAGILDPYAVMRDYYETVTEGNPDRFFAPPIEAMPDPEQEPPTREEDNPL
jgi:hypothetical protein